MNVHELGGARRAGLCAGRASSSYLGCVSLFRFAPYQRHTDVSNN